jgi:hypothetical protein
MNATKLRSELYAVLDSVLQTGKPVTIERKGKVLQLVLVDEKKKRKKVKWPKPDPGSVNGDPDDIVNIDYLEEWRKEWGL